MVKKCWTEGGDKGVNNNSIDLESRNDKTIGQIYKNASYPICRLCEQKPESIGHLESCWPILIQTGYKKMA